MARTGLINSKIGAQFHRTTHPFWDITERPVGEDGTVQRCVEIIAFRNDGSKVFTDQFRVLLNGFTHRTEDDALFRQRLFKRGGYRNGIHYHVHGHTAQSLLLVQADAQTLEGLEEFGIHFVQAVQFFLLLRCAVVRDRLEFRFFIRDVWPLWFFHLAPNTERIQTPFQHPFRLVFLGTDHANDLLVQAGRHLVALNVRRKAVLIVGGGDFV